MSYLDKSRQLNSYLTQGLSVLLNVMIPPPRRKDTDPELIMKMLLMDVEHLGKVVAGPTVTGSYWVVRLNPVFGATHPQNRVAPQSVYVYPADF